MKQFRVDEKMYYYPFPSKIFALLYILIHVHIPSYVLMYFYLLGTTISLTTGYIWFILNKCGIKVPSLSFKVLGVDMPQRVS